MSHPDHVLGSQETHTCISTTPLPIHLLISTHVNPVMYIHNTHGVYCILSSLFYVYIVPALSEFGIKFSGDTPLYQKNIYT